MKTIETIGELKRWVRKSKTANWTIGFVPTMGYLHEGHLALAARAREENDLVIMSIFVNPAQFGPNEDFDRYPRNLKRDAELAEKAGVDILFAPSVGEMYPHETSTVIQAGSQAAVLCGQSRPGHFDGVLKVVTKLFHLTEADRAYFGQKDAQQLAVIETLVRDFNFPIEIRRVETVREADGLAKSSRNIYLTHAERQEAASLHEALEIGKRKALEGTDPVPSVQAYLEKHVSGKVDYVQFLSYPLLTADITNEAILAVAVQFEKARLIDNVLFTVKES